MAVAGQASWNAGFSVDACQRCGHSPARHAPSWKGGLKGCRYTCECASAVKPCPGCGGWMSVGGTKECWTCYRSNAPVRRLERKTLPLLAAAKAKAEIELQSAERTVSWLHRRQHPRLQAAALRADRRLVVRAADISEIELAAMRAVGVATAEQARIAAAVACHEEHRLMRALLEAHAASDRYAREAAAARRTQERLDARLRREAAAEKRREQWRVRRGLRGRDEDELSFLIRQQARDARSYLVGHGGVVSLDATVPGTASLARVDVFEVGIGAIGGIWSEGLCDRCERESGDLQDGWCPACWAQRERELRALPTEAFTYKAHSRRGVRFEASDFDERLASTDDAEETIRVPGRLTRKKARANEDVVGPIKARNKVGAKQSNHIIAVRGQQDFSYRGSPVRVRARGDEHDPQRPFEWESAD